MLFKMNPSFGGGVDVLDAPKITFDGSWLPWHIDFYDSVPYWEAWFFSSGTLTLSQDYVIDAWGLGGGGATARADTSPGGAGVPAMALGCAVPAGSVAVTIGAGARNTDGSSWGPNRGGRTSFGGYLTAQGGQYADSPAEHNYDAYNRFGDTTKNEAARAPFEYDETYELGGWLNFTCPGNIREAHGIGAGGWPEGTSGSYGGSGALVVRIKME